MASSPLGRIPPRTTWQCIRDAVILNAPVSGTRRSCACSSGSEESLCVSCQNEIDNRNGRSPHMLIDLNLLLEYIDWERQKWHESFGQHGDRVLMSSAGPHS